MAKSKSEFAKLTPEKKLELAQKFAQRLADAAYKDGIPGLPSTNEAEFERVAKELRTIGDSSFIDEVDQALRGVYQGGFEAKGLRDLILSEFSFDDEDRMLNAFGYPTDDLLGESQQELSTTDPNKSNLGKFSADGIVPSDEYSVDEAIVADNEGSGGLSDRAKDSIEIEDFDDLTDAVDNDLGISPSKVQTPTTARPGAPSLDNPDPQKVSPATAAKEALANSQRVFGGDSEISKLERSEAIRRIQNEKASQKKQDSMNASRAHQENVLAEMWEKYSPTGRADGRRWADLPEDMKRDLRKKYVDSYKKPSSEKKNQKIQ